MNKLNLVIDFNNISIRSLFTCRYIPYASSGVHFDKMDTDEEAKFFISKLATDMCYIMRIFVPNRVIIVCDSKNEWRKDLYAEYKATRQKDEDLNWDKIYSTMHEFKQVLKKAGYAVCEINKAEADDLASLWRKVSYSEGDDVLLVSSDKDWTQLTDFNGKNFCMCFNPIPNNKGKKVLYMTHDAESWLLSGGNKTDIFNMGLGNTKNNIMDSVMVDKRIEFTLIEPSKVLLEKVMCGDDGDNVPSMMEFYRSGRKTRVTPLKSQKILEQLESPDMSGIIKGATDGKLKEALEGVMKQDTDFDVPERVMRQRLLVELDPDLFPEEIKENFGYMLKDMEKVGFIHPDYMKASYMLANSRFVVPEKPSRHLNNIFDRYDSTVNPNPGSTPSMPLNYEPKDLPPIAKKSRSISLF